MGAEGFAERASRELAAAGPVSASETDRMLRDVLGVDRAELVRGWQSYLRKALK